MSKKLMFVVNVDWFFISHRLPIALEALRQGYEVHIAVGITNKQAMLQSLGLIVHPLTLERSSTHIGSTLKTWGQLFSVFRKVRPDIVHLISIKPVLLGGIAARLVGIPSVVVAVSGLGFVFLAQGIKASLRRIIVAALYRLALGKHNLKVIFQNPSDRDNLVSLTSLSTSKIEMIRGSGVDLNRYVYKPLPEGAPVIIMAARLLVDKGVREFVDAARLITQRGKTGRFCLVGSLDQGNPACLSTLELTRWSSEGIVEIWGHKEDMAEVLSDAHIVVLPSYREGLPKVLIEAAASGRAVITTNVPGCRDAIEPEVTGLLVPARDSVALADAIQDLMADPDRCKAMGLAGRALAEKEFDLSIVVEKHLSIYQHLLQNVSL